MVKAAKAWGKPLQSHVSCSVRAGAAKKPMSFYQFEAGFSLLPALRFAECRTVVAVVKTSARHNGLVAGLGLGLSGLALQPTFIHLG